MPSSICPRQFDRILIGICPAQCEQKLCQSGWDNLGQHFTQDGARSGCHTRSSKRQFARLPGDRIDHACITVPDIGAHDHRIEIQISFSGRIPKIDTFGAWTGIGRTWPGLTRSKSCVPLKEAGFRYRQDRTYRPR
jgi:hypothetical protein